MQIEHELPNEEATVEVFRELGLEDTELIDHFRQLAKQSDWHKWIERPSEPQDTQNNTLEECTERDAQLESAS